jgi:hypothetical protein
MAYPATLDLDEDIKRRRTEDALSALIDTSGDSNASSSDDNQPVVTDHEIKKYNLIPEPEADKKLDTATDKQAVTPPDIVYPKIAQDQPQGLPVTKEYPRISPPPPEPADVQTDPETGTRYVSDASGAVVPHAELATEADKQAFRPSDAVLPQVDVTGVGAVQPAPDRLTQVERAQLVAFPDRTPATMPWHPAGEAPDTLPQVERATLIKLPPKPVPGFIEGSDNAIVNPAAGVIPPTAKPAYPDKIVTPDEFSGKTSVVNAPSVATADQPKAAAPPVTPAGQAKPDATAEPSTLYGMPIAGREQAAAVQPQENRVQSGRDLTGTDPRLTDIVTNAANALPAGYTIRPTSGVRTAGQGQHTLGKAQDWQIFDAKGNPVVNRGDDSTGLYSLLARNAYGYQEKYYPELTGQFQWGGQFGTSTANNPNEPDLMHFDIGGRRGRIERYSRENIGASLPSDARAAAPSRYGKLIPEGQDDTAATTTQPQGKDTAAQPAGSFVSGRATTFGYHDPEDEGVGSPSLGQINTNDPKLVGIAVPEEALRRQLGSNKSDWRTARVEVVTPNGQHYLMPIVDIGPRDTSKQRGVAADFTHGASVLLNHNDSNNYQFRIVANAGPDAEKNPQDFIAEQRSLAAGKTYQPQAADAASSRYGKLIPEAEVPPPTAAEIAAKAEAERAAVAASTQKLLDKYKDAPNLGTVYKDIDNNTDVPPEVRGTIKANIQKQMTDQMIEYDPDLKKLSESGPEGLKTAQALAWAKWHNSKGEIVATNSLSMNPNATDGINADSIKDVFSKVVGAHIAFTNTLQNPIDTERSVLNRFFKYSGLDTPKQQQDVLSHLHGLSAQEQYDYLNKILPQDTGVTNVPYSMEVIQAMNHLADPNWVQFNTARRTKDVHDAAVKMAGDPRMRGTFGGGVGDTVSALTGMAEAGMVPGDFGFLMQAADAEHAKIKAEHPDWTEDQINRQAIAGSLINSYGQMAGMHVFSTVFEPLLARVGNPVLRRLGNAVASAFGAGATGATASIITNPADPEEAKRQAIQGGALGFVGGIRHEPPGRERAVPPPLPEQNRTEPPPPVTEPVQPSVTTREAPPVPPPASGEEQRQAQQPPPPRFPTQEHAAVFDDLTSRGMDADRARAYVNRAQGRTEGEILSDVQAQMRAEQTQQPSGVTPPAFPSTVHAKVFQDLVNSGVDQQTARDAVMSARGNTHAEILLNAVRNQIQEPIERHTDQDLEQRMSEPVQQAGHPGVEPSIRPSPPQANEQGMTDDEVVNYLDRLNSAVERRQQARAGDVGLIPGVNHPEASVHENGTPPPLPPPASSNPPERFAIRAQDTAAPRGVSVPEANKIVNAFREQFPHAPPIEVVGNRDELAPHLQEAIQQHAGASTNAVEAFVHDGRIHVIADENLSPEALHKTLLEEGIGHYGVESVLGDKFNPLADVVSKTMAGHPQYEHLKALYGDDPRVLAGEYIARTARGQIENPTIWAHVKTFFNQLARRLGWQRPFSDSELRVLLSRAKGRLEKGGGRAAISTGTRFRIRGPNDYEALRESAGASKEMLRAPKGPLYYRSAYDELSRNPDTAPLAAALMHHIDRAKELNAQLTRPIREAFHGIKRGELKAVLADFSKIQEAKDNKQPIPHGLHPKAYELNRAVTESAKQVAKLADANKILIRDPRLNGGKGGWRKFSSVADYVPRNVKREVIDTMRMRQTDNKAALRWKGIVDEFVNKGYAKNENEVIEKLKDAANLDSKHIDKKLGNLEKARTSRLPSSMYEYSLTGMLDYIRKVSDRMGQIEAYGQKAGEHGKDLFERTAEKINSGPTAGTQAAKDMTGYIKFVRNKALGLDEPTPIGKAMAITRSLATGLDLSGWTGMVNDLIGSLLQTPTTMGVWNTGKGYVHALTHYKTMLEEAHNLGVVHHDFATSTRELEHDFSTSSMTDKLGRASQKIAQAGMTISLRNAQEPFIRVMTLGASKSMLRDAVDTIKANPASSKAGAYAHFLSRRGVDVSRLVDENGTGPETDRFLRRAVADTQAGYDMIQRSPYMETPSGKFFGQYLSWGINQTRNVMREIVLPLTQPGKQKTLDITVNGKKYTVSDDRFTAVKRGLILMAGAATTGFLKDQFKEFFTGRINSYRDVQQLAAEIASDPDKARVFGHVMRAGLYQLMTSGMLGLLGNGAQLLEDPTDRSRYKDLMKPTAVTKLEGIWTFIRHQMQEGQFDSHEGDALLRNMSGAYREGKPALARLLNQLGYRPDFVREEITRGSIAGLRNTLRRYNDEQGLGLKPPAFQTDFDVSKNTPVARSIVDALYRGDAITAKKILADYLKAAPNAAEAKKRLNSITSSVQSATPLKLGSKSNKEFAQGFWDWAQQKGNVTKAQIEDYKKVVNDFANTAFAAGFKRELQIVPEEGDKKIVITKRVPRTSNTEILREMIRRENAQAALQAH